MPAPAGETILSAVFHRGQVYEAYPSHYEALKKACTAGELDHLRKQGAIGVPEKEEVPPAPAPPPAPVADE